MTAIKLSETMVKYLEYLAGEHKTWKVQQFADTVATAFEILGEEPEEARLAVAGWLCEGTDHVVISKAELEKIKSAIPPPPGPNTLDDRTREVPLAQLEELREKTKSVEAVREKKGSKR